MTQTQRDQFTAVLTELKLPKEAADILLTQADAHPAIADGYLRQAEASRRFAEAEKTKQDYQGLYDANLQWKTNKEKVLNDAVSEATRLREQLANAGKGGDVDAAAVQAVIDERISKLQVPDGAAIAKIVQEEVTKAADQARKEVVEQTLPAMLQITRQYGRIERRHFSEFNEELDNKALGEFMQQHQIADPEAGWQQWTQERRTQAEIQRKVQEGVTAEVKRMQTNGEVPGSGAMPTSRELGPVQILRAGQVPKADGQPDNTRLGDGAAASGAAADLMAEGKY